MTAVKSLVLGALVVLAASPQSASSAPSHRGWLRWASSSPNSQSAFSNAFDAPVFPPPIYLPPPPALLPPPTVYEAPTVPASTASFGTGLWRWASSESALSAQPRVQAISQVPAEPTFDVDAVINLGSGPYPREGQLTSGGASPWFYSPSATRVFGGVPDEMERSAFGDAVLERVELAFERSGVPVTLSDDTSLDTPHTLSVVSNTDFPGNPEAVGIAEVGRDGFSFVDKLPYADTPDELAWVVAHNVSHELMHTFGGDHRDTTGSFLDAAVTPWALLADTNARFSQEAVADLRSQDFRAIGVSTRTHGLGLCDCHGADAQTIMPQPVPEPATIVLWLAAGTLVVAGRRKARAGEGRRALLK